MELGLADDNNAGVVDKLTDGVAFFFFLLAISLIVIAGNEGADKAQGSQCKKKFSHIYLLSVQIIGRKGTNFKGKENSEK